MKRYAGSLAVFFVIFMLFAGNVARAEGSGEFEAAISFRNAQGELLSGKEIATIIGRHWRELYSFDDVQISSNYSFQLEEGFPRRLTIMFFNYPSDYVLRKGGDSFLCLWVVLDPAVQYQKITVLNASTKGRCAWASATLRNFFAELDAGAILGTLQ
ncbi:MAG TPA: hypothetical protein VJB70_01185 [Candidatus Paceibacterota bacterium]